MQAKNVLDICYFFFILKILLFLFYFENVYLRKNGVTVWNWTGKTVAVRYLRGKQKKLLKICSGKHHSGFSCNVAYISSSSNIQWIVEQMQKSRKINRCKARYMKYKRVKFENDTALLWSLYYQDSSMLHYFLSV